MLTEKQLKILEIFSDNVFKEYTFKDLKQKSKEKSNSFLENAVKKFHEENLISEKKIGTSKLLTLNLENEKVFSYLSIIFEKKLDKSTQDTIKRIKSEIDKYTHLYSLVIFGSYADKTQTKKSDLDVAIIIQDKKQEKNIKIAINTAKNRSLLEIDAHIITEDEFMQMLLADYENLGKQIARKNLPVHNINIFYKIIRKGMKHGFAY